jgi:flagellar hook-basal body complex protein FliE
MTKIGAITSASFGERLLSELKQTGQDLSKLDLKISDKKTDSPSFQDHLSSSIKDINQSQREADKMSTNLITGKDQNIHETMLAATKAELSFNLMVQIRNKALEAYQEIMRMPV